MESSVVRSVRVRRRHSVRGSFRSILGGAVGALLVAWSTPAWAGWPTLDEVWRASRAQAPESVAAQSATLVARSEGVGARASSFDNPVVQITADHGVGRTPLGASNGLQALGIVGLPIEIAGQRGARIRSVEALVSWREREQAAVEGRVAGQAIGAYGRAVVARARVEQASQAEEQAQTELAWFEARTQAGDATAVDRSLAQTELAQHAQLRAEAQIDLVEARADLRALTGLEDLGEPPVDAASRPPQVGAAARQTEQTLASIPRIEAFEREQAYWGRQVEEAEAKRWAPLQVLVSAGQDEFGLVRVGGGLAWALPIVRRNEGEIARATAARARARAERDAVVRAVDATARGLDERLLGIGAAIVDLEGTGVPAAERLVQATDAAFRAGKLELVRVLNARRDLTRMRERRLDLVEASWRAYGDLAAILGVLP